MSNETSPIRRAIRPRSYQFTLRALLGAVLFAAIAIVVAQYLWPRRTITSIVVSPTIQVDVFEPHLDEIALQSPNIGTLRVDRRINAIVFTAQARHFEEASGEVQDLVREGR